MSSKDSRWSFSELLRSVCESCQHKHTLVTCSVLSCVCELVIRFTSQTHTRVKSALSCCCLSLWASWSADIVYNVSKERHGLKCAPQVPWIMPAKTSKSSTAAKRAAEARDESDEDVSAPAASSTPPAREHGKTSRGKFLSSSATDASGLSFVSSDVSVFLSHHGSFV